MDILIPYLMLVVRYYVPLYIYLVILVYFVVDDTNNNLR